MRIELTGRGVDINPALSQMARERLGRVARHLPSATEAHVIFGAVKNRRSAEIVMRGKGKTFKVSEESSSAEDALLAASETLEKVVRKYVDRKIDRRRRGGRARPGAEGRFEMSVVEMAAEEMRAAEEARIVRSQEYEAKVLSLEDAIKELKAMRSQFLVFRNVATGFFNILYRREDGQMGLLELKK